MNVAAVIPVGAGREDNLALVLESLSKQTSRLRVVVLVCDGEDAASSYKPDISHPFGFPVVVARIEKHQPGREQPRNVGVRFAEKAVGADLSHVWFLDSDVIVGPDCLEKYEQAMAAEAEPRILVGPYDWLPPGVRHPLPDLRNDPAGVPYPGRWGRFDKSQPWEIYRNDLAAGLGCFSGNLVWPTDLFKRVGGFWNELHHGRCEDGELGIRAVAMGIGISFVTGARGWHLDHGRDIGWITRTNAIDVPKLAARHPWRELEHGDELFVVDEDGKRFNVRCGQCGESFNSNLIWTHQEECNGN